LGRPSTTAADEKFSNGQDARERADVTDLSPDCQIVVIFFVFCIFWTLEPSTV
jgi:hypothetical protein